MRSRLLRLGCRARTLALQPFLVGNSGTARLRRLAARGTLGVLPASGSIVAGSLRVPLLLVSVGLRVLIASLRLLRGTVGRASDEREDLANLVLGRGESGVECGGDLVQKPFGLGLCLDPTDTSLLCVTESIHVPCRNEVTMTYVKDQDGSLG